MSRSFFRDETGRKKRRKIPASSCNRDEVELDGFKRFDRIKALYEQKSKDEFLQEFLNPGDGYATRDCIHNVAFEAEFTATQFILNKFSSKADIQRIFSAQSNFNDNKDKPFISLFIGQQHEIGQYVDDFYNPDPDDEEDASMKRSNQEMKIVYKRDCVRRQFFIAQVRKIFLQYDLLDLAGELNDRILKEESLENSEFREGVAGKFKDEVKEIVDMSLEELEAFCFNNANSIIEWQLEYVEKYFSGTNYIDAELNEVETNAVLVGLKALEPLMKSFNCHMTQSNQDRLAALIACLDVRAQSLQGEPGPSVRILRSSRA